MDVGTPRGRLAELVLIIVEARLALGLALGLFLLGVVGGARGPLRLSGEDLRSMPALWGSGWLWEALTIFVSNAALCYFALGLSVLWGVAPAALSVSNGAVLGSVLDETHYASGVWWAILPHAALEVPIFLLCCGLGIWRGAVWLRRGLRDERQRRFRSSLAAYRWLVLPLLALAAVIETRP